MTGTTTPQPMTLLVLERDLCDPGDEWRAALTALEARFARAHLLDAAAVLDHAGFDDQVAALDAWAVEAGIDLDTELGRWFDEHLSMHVRPDPARTRALRATARERQVHVATALPPRPAESLLRHAGMWRSVAHLHAGVRGDAARERLRTSLAYADSPPEP